jgi:isopentenyl phosphate kinase
MILTESDAFLSHQHLQLTPHHLIEIEATAEIFQYRIVPPYSFEYPLGNEPIVLNLTRVIYEYSNMPKTIRSVWGSTLANSKIVIKFGGGLITDKTQFKTIKAQNLDSVCGIIANVLEKGNEVIIVHGAGSFGHLEAKKWKLATGYDRSIIEEQRIAVEKVRRDMLELNKIVIDNLNKFGINSISHPPSLWANGLGPEFKGDINRFKENNSDTIHVTFGDVVDINDKREFGILSGDDLMVRICNEIPGISHCIFLLGDTEGLLTKPPNEKGAELIPIWSKDQEITGVHEKSQDVTGGIFLKAESASIICQKIPNVWMLDGRKPERIQELIQTGNTTGTKVI